MYDCCKDKLAADQSIIYCPFVDFVNVIPKVENSNDRFQIDMVLTTTPKKFENAVSISCYCNSCLGQCEGKGWVWLNFMNFSCKVHAWFFVGVTQPVREN